MNTHDAKTVMQDLVDSYGKKLSTAETQTWYRRVFQFMDLEVGLKTTDKIIGEAGLFGRKDYFPTIPFFLEISRSITGNATITKFPTTVCNECQNDRWVEKADEGTYRPCSICKPETHGKWADGEYYKNPGYGGKVDEDYVTEKAEGKENLDVLRFQMTQLSKQKGRKI